MLSTLFPEHASSPGDYATSKWSLLYWHCVTRQKVSPVRWIHSMFGMTMIQSGCHIAPVWHCHFLTKRTSYVSHVKRRIIPSLICSEAKTGFENRLRKFVPAVQNGDLPLKKIQPKLLCILILQSCNIASH